MYGARDKDNVEIDNRNKKKHKRRTYSNSSSLNSDEWVETKTATEKLSEGRSRDDWMSMTGVMKTYTREDVRPKQDKKDKKHIDSYNPGTNTRELNPYWKDGGTGLPQTSEQFRKSKPFVKPDHDEGFYKKSYYTKDYKIKESDKSQQKIENSNKDEYQYKRTYNWKKGSEDDGAQSYITSKIETSCNNTINSQYVHEENLKTKKGAGDSMYLSDEKMNKLAAKIVKAEIMGDIKLVNELKSKLENARKYRKDNPNAFDNSNEDEKVMLMTTSATGNSRPLTKSSHYGNSESKGCKRKAETHLSGERTKYFSNDDKYCLKEMFEQEKYGSNYNNEDQFMKVFAKHKNPNDDIEDIFTDEISKNVSDSKYDDMQKQNAIKEHRRVEKSLEDCKYCVGSKKMLKHLMVSCGNNVYLALPFHESLVKDHCILTTIQHSTCTTAVDEDVWDEIVNYRKAVTKFFNSQDKDVVFFESAMQLHKFPHMVINCVPLPRDVGDTASIYFKKALLDCGSEWAMNKKVVELKGKNIRKGIPKGLPYFWVDFGMDPGFAHVIEDQQQFRKTFAQEIIGGMLDLEYNTWKNPQRENSELQRKKVVEFIKGWKPFDIIQNK